MTRYAQEVTRTKERADQFWSGHRLYPDLERRLFHLDHPSERDLATWPILKRAIERHILHRLLLLSAVLLVLLIALFR